MDLLIKPAYAQLQPKADIGDAYDLSFPSLGVFVQTVIPLIFSIASMMVVFYFIIGSFELITSQGDKAHIVSARSKIYHSIIGFILIIALFIILQYVIPAVLGPNTSFKVI